MIDCLESPCYQVKEAPFQATEAFAMAKRSLLAGITIVGLLLAQSKAHAIYGLYAYGAIDAGYLYTYESLVLGSGGPNAIVAGEWGYLALEFANAAYAYKNPVWYYYASAYSLVAVD